jgi:STE24 endopeptidase
MINVDAATAAWLARIPEAQRLDAQAFSDWRLTAWVVGELAVIAACAFMISSGVLGHWRRALEAARPRPWLAGAACAGLLALVLASLEAVIQAVTSWRGQEIQTHRAQNLLAALAGAAGAIAPEVIAGVLLLPVALWLMRRLPRTWPLVVGTAIMGLIVLAVWLPYVLSLGPPMTPAPPGPVRDGLVRLIAETGIPAHEVYYATDPAFDADVNGGFGQAKVSVGPLMAAAPPAESRAFVGHIMGHYAHNDILIYSLVLGLVMELGCFAVNWWAAPVARWLGARGAASAAEPEVLPAAAIVFLLAMVCAGLAGTGYLRWANVRADAYSLEHAREPDGLVAAMEGEWNHESVDPSPIEEAIFSSHPAMVGRIRHAMVWKAAHGG